jgi:hypothetical protein
MVIRLSDVSFERFDLRERLPGRDFPGAQWGWYPGQ